MYVAPIKQIIFARNRDLFQGTELTSLAYFMDSWVNGKFCLIKLSDVIGFHLNDSPLQLALLKRGSRCEFELRAKTTFSSNAGLVFKGFLRGHTAGGWVEGRFSGHLASQCQQ